MESPSNQSALDKLSAEVDQLTLEDEGDPVYIEAFKMITARAKEYGQLTNTPYETIIEKWESDREGLPITAYYDEREMPPADQLITLKDWKEKLNGMFGSENKWAFVCPKCEGIQTIKQFKNKGVSANFAPVVCLKSKAKPQTCDFMTLGKNKTKTAVLDASFKVHFVFEPIDLNNPTHRLKAGI